MPVQLNLVADRPVFSAILIDASGSMAKYANSVIEAHRIMLDTLRKSEKCGKGVLYVYQCLFAARPSALNVFFPLRHDGPGHDKVKLLDASNYRPEGNTALYDAVMQVLQELTAQQKASFRQGIPSSARIAVITDGEDRCSTAQPQQVQETIRNLRSDEWLEASVVVGLKNGEFDETRLVAVKEALGFSQHISLEKSEQEIRRAFVLASRFLAGKA